MMKIRSNLHAGDALRDCQRQRDYWKNQAYRMEQIASGPGPIYNPQPPTYPTTPTTPTYPTTPVGGWVGGVYYSDKSGWCG
jgi:hypothetical protein